MMGPAHALSGACAFSLAALPAHLPPDQYAIGIAICAGAAVLPDIDHPGSGVSRTFWHVTRGFAWVVCKLSGGHRNGTHSFLGTAVFTALVFAATGLHTGRIQTIRIGALIAAGLLAAGLLTGLTEPKGKGRGKRAYKEKWQGPAATMLCVAAVGGLGAATARYGQIVGSVILGVLLVLVLAAVVRLFRIPGILDDLAPIPVVAAALYFGVDLTVVPYAVALGVVVHIAGDMITRGGCPLGWPWSQTMRGPQWILTGGVVENRAIRPALIVLTAGAIAVQAGLPDLVRTWT